MHLDVVDLRDFYASPVGLMVARQLAPVVASLVRADSGTRVLGFGFATPYLGACRARSASSPSCRRGRG